MLGDNFAMISSSSTSINIITYFYVSVCRYEPGMSKKLTYQTSCVSTAAGFNTNSIATLVKVASSLLIVSFCFLLSAHAYPFMYPLHFPFRIIIYGIASDLFLLVWLCTLGQRSLVRVVAPVPS